MDNKPTQAQISLLWHTLGLRPECRDSRHVYRNRFLAGQGHDDMPDLDALVALGLMGHRKPPAFCDQEEILYFATKEGEAVAVSSMPPLPKLTRYEQFLNADIDCTFAEWLGIEKPKLEHSGSSWWGKDRKFRFSTSRATGEWCPTQKEAKASYKVALKNAAPRERRTDYSLYAGL